MGNPSSHGSVKAPRKPDDSELARKLLINASGLDLSEQPPNHDYDLAKSASHLARMICEKLVESSELPTDNDLEMGLNTAFVTDHKFRQVPPQRRHHTDRDERTTEHLFGWQSAAIMNLVEDLASETLRVLPEMARKHELGTRSGLELYERADEFFSSNKVGKRSCEYYKNFVTLPDTPQTVAALDGRAAEMGQSFHLFKTATELKSHIKTRAHRRPEVENMAFHTAGALYERHEGQPPSESDDVDLTILVSEFLGLFNLQRPLTRPITSFPGNDEISDWLPYAGDCFFTAVQYWLDRWPRVQGLHSRKPHKPMSGGWFDQFLPFVREREFWYTLRDDFTRAVETMARGKDDIGTGCRRPHFGYWLMVKTRESDKDLRDDGDPYKILLEIVRKHGGLQCEGTGRQAGARDR